MDWRTWIYDRLRLDASILADVPATDIYGAGSLIKPPARRPFIVIRFNAESPEVQDADAPMVTSQRGTIWVHDTPGDYLRIDRILRNTRTLIAGNVTGMKGNGGGGIMAIWEGVSGDFADDVFGTITKYGEFRLVGKVA